MFSCTNENKLMTINDLSFLREDMTISFQQNDSGCQNVESNYKFNIKLPFPGVCTKKEEEELIFRTLFKPESG